MNQSAEIVRKYEDTGGPKKYGSYGSESGTLVHLHHSSKIKGHKEVTKHFFEVCLTILIDDGRIRRRIRTGD
jgi:hypothetical protein